jgi:hypothetical protein
MEVYSHLVANILVIWDSIEKNVKFYYCQVLKTNADDCITL